MQLTALSANKTPNEAERSDGGGGGQGTRNFWAYL